MNLKLFIRRVQYIERNTERIHVHRGHRNYRLSELEEEQRFQEAMLLAIRNNAPVGVFDPAASREDLNWWNDPAAAQQPAKCADCGAELSPGHCCRSRRHAYQN